MKVDISRRLFRDWDVRYLSPERAVTLTTPIQSALLYETRELVDSLTLEMVWSGAISTIEEPPKDCRSVFALDLAPSYLLTICTPLG
jgi:hypothetical protein